MLRLQLAMIPLTRNVPTSERDLRFELLRCDAETKEVSSGVSHQTSVEPSFKRPLDEAIG